MFPDDRPQFHAGHQAIDPSQRKAQPEGTQNNNQEGHFDVVGVELKIVKTHLYHIHILHRKHGYDDQKQNYENKFKSGHNIWKDLNTHHPQIVHYSGWCAIRAFIPLLPLRHPNFLRPRNRPHHLRSSQSLN